MKALRAFCFVLGMVVNVAWLVSVTMRMSISAPDLTPQLAAGPIPPAPPSLPPLVIPRRDPFAADRQRSVSAPEGDAEAAKSGVSAINVPDVASFAANRNEGVVATIVGRDESYALVEEGATVHIVHVGDAFGGSRIFEIATDHVRLANGTRIAMLERPKGNPVQATTPSADVPSGSPSPSAAPSPSSTFSAGAPPRPTSGVQAPAGTVVQPQPIIGRPLVSQPNGTPDYSGGSLFSSSLPTPTVVPVGAAMPGGHP